MLRAAAGRLAARRNLAALGEARRIVADVAAVFHEHGRGAHKGADTGHSRRILRLLHLGSLHLVLELLALDIGRLALTLQADLRPLGRSDEGLRAGAEGLVAQLHALPGHARSLSRVALSGLRSREILAYGLIDESHPLQLASLTRAVHGGAGGAGLREIRGEVGEAALELRRVNAVRGELPLIVQSRGIEGLSRVGRGGALRFRYASGRAPLLRGGEILVRSPDARCIRPLPGLSGCERGRGLRAERLLSSGRNALLAGDCVLRPAELILTLRLGLLADLSARACLRRGIRSRGGTAASETDGRYS